MAELVGVATLGWTVTKFLNQVVKEFQRLKNVPSDVRKLRDLLERLEPSVEVLSTVPNADQPAGKWLSAVKEQLEMAHAVAEALDQKDKIAYLYNLARTSRKVEKVFNSLRDLLTEASAHQWASRMTANRILAENDARNRDEFERLREMEEDLKRVLENLLTTCATKDDIQRELSIVEQDLSSLSLGGSSSSDEVPARNSAEQVPKVKVTFGGDGVLNDIRAHLLEGDYRKWVGLWGMGGIGKTFTARKICHDSAIQKRFSDGILWVTVSKDRSDAEDICSRLIEQVSKSSSLEKKKVPKNVESAQMYLKELLESKSILLILDDVWKDSEDDCDDVLQDLDVVSEESKSVILVTTRDETVLEGVDDSKKFEIPVLSDTDSWLLFSWYAFGRRGRQIPPDLEVIAEDVARECRGLPLALEVIGSTMANRRLSTREEGLGLSERDVWQRSLDHLRKANLGNSEYLNLYARLQLSIDSLEDHHLDCFLYFAAFPEDDIIPLEKLLAIWIAEGLVESEEDAKLVLAGLVAKSMIGMIRNDFSDRCEFRVHDVMRDLAQRNLKRDLDAGKQIPAPDRDCLYASGLNMSALPEEWFKSADAHRAKRARRSQGERAGTFLARRLSLMQNNLKKFPGTHRFCAPHLQVLILSGNRRLTSLSAEFFGELSNLKVLDLSYTGIEMIDDGVLLGLRSLVLLDLTGCSYLAAVPDEVNDLQSLEHLSLRDCTQLTELPRLNKLTKLRFCSLAIPKKFWTECGGATIRVLSENRQTEDDDMVNQTQEDEEENNVRQTDEEDDDDTSFQAEMDDDDERKHADDEDMRAREDEEESAQENHAAPGVEDVVWNPLLFPKNLRELHLQASLAGSGFRECSVDISSLFLLERLELEGFVLSPVGLAHFHHLTYVKMWPKDSDGYFPVLGKLPKLEHLRVHGHLPGCRPGSCDAGAFPCLKSLYIYISEEKDFAFHPGTMPKIENLRVSHYTTHSLPRSIAELRTLKRLRIDSISTREMRRSDGEEFDLLFNQDDFLPNLECLRLEFSTSFVQTRADNLVEEIDFTREMENLFPQHWLRRRTEGQLTIVIDQGQAC